MHALVLWWQILAKKVHKSYLPEWKIFLASRKPDKPPSSLLEEGRTTKLEKNLSLKRTMYYKLGKKLTTLSLSLSMHPWHGRGAHISYMNKHVKVKFQKRGGLARFDFFFSFLCTISSSWASQKAFFFGAQAAEQADSFDLRHIVHANTWEAVTYIFQKKGTSFSFFFRYS